MEPIDQTNEERKAVWVSAMCAALGAIVGRGPGSDHWQARTAAAVADAALVEFDKRYAPRSTPLAPEEMDKVRHRFEGAGHYPVGADHMPTLREADLEADALLRGRPMGGSVGAAVQPQYHDPNYDDAGDPMPPRTCSICRAPYEPGIIPCDCPNEAEWVSDTAPFIAGDRDPA